MYDCSWMGTVHKSAGKLLYVDKKEVVCDQFHGHSRAKLSTKTTKYLVRNKKRSSMLNMKGGYS